MGRVAAYHPARIMSRRSGRELETLPHYVYAHLNKAGAVIYVGRTSDPEHRPTDTKRRRWIATESASVIVSPAMPFEAAAWVETEMIRAISPKRNDRSGQTLRNIDWRIDRWCEAEGVTRADAGWAVKYAPTDPDEFEAYLAQRKAAVAAYISSVEGEMAS